MVIHLLFGFIFIGLMQACSNPIAEQSSTISTSDSNTVEVSAQEPPVVEDTIIDYNTHKEALPAVATQDAFSARRFLWIAKQDLLNAAQEAPEVPIPYIAYMGDEWYASIIGKESEPLLASSQVTIDEEQAVNPKALDVLMLDEPVSILIRKTQLILKGKVIKSVDYHPVNVMLNLKLIGNFVSAKEERIAFNGVNVVGIPNAFSYVIGLFDDDNGKLSYILITSDKDITVYDEEGHHYQFFIIERSTTKVALYKPVWKTGNAPKVWELYSGEEFGFSPSKGELQYELSLDQN